MFFWYSNFMAILRNSLNIKELICDNRMITMIHLQQKLLPAEAVADWGGGGIA